MRMFRTERGDFTEKFACKRNSFKMRGNGNKRKKPVN